MVSNDGKTTAGPRGQCVAKKKKKKGKLVSYLVHALRENVLALSRVRVASHRYPPEFNLK